ncbi:hypothetical protein KGA66_26975, partial [Actinocrinis puniceicyclus]
MNGRVHRRARPGTRLGEGTLIAAAGYSEYGQPVQYMYGGAGTDTVWADMTYDPQTQALTDIQTT